eukprot:scaffold84257_cov28-Attheya_sp.AAC.1
MHPRTGGLSNKARKAILKATRAIQGVEIVLPSIPNPSVRTVQNAAAVDNQVEQSWNVELPHASGSSVYSLDDAMAAKQPISMMKTIDVDPDTLTSPMSNASIHHQSPCGVNKEPPGGLYIDPDAISDDADGELLYVDPDQIPNDVCAPPAKMRKLDGIERNYEDSPRKETHRRERELKCDISDSQKQDARKDTLKATSTKPPLEEVVLQNGPLPSASAEQNDVADCNTLDGSSKKAKLGQASHEIGSTVHSHCDSVAVANTIFGNIVVTNKGKRYVVVIEDDVEEEEEEDDEILMMDTADTSKGDQPSDMYVDPDAIISDKEIVSENEPVDDVYIDPDAIMPGNAYIDPDAISSSGEGDNAFDVDSNHDLDTDQIDTKPDTVGATPEVSNRKSDDHLFLHTTKSRSADTMLQKPNEADTTIGCRNNNNSDQEASLKSKSKSTGATASDASLQASEVPVINSEYNDCVMLDAEEGVSVIGESHSGETTGTIPNDDSVISEQIYQDSDEIEEMNTLDDMRKMKSIQLDVNTTSDKVDPPLVRK